MNARSNAFKGLKGLTLTGTIAVLVACGGGSSDDDDVVSGSSPVVARGVITQLGSIHVNGVKYETPNGGSYSDDDSTGSVAAYKVGQVVSIRGRRNDDGVTGTADEVKYEAEIEGSALSGQINGVTILITPKTNTDDITGNTLVDNQRYEVSGVWIDDITIEATYIEDDDDLEDEIKGFVKNLGVAFPDSFDVRGITFRGYTGVPALMNDDFVEVHFDAASCGVPPCTLTSVELEDDFFDDGEGPEYEIEGAADFDTTGCPADADFKIDMTCIDWDNKPAEFMDGLTVPADVVEGSRVEAEGHIAGGLLVADKIKGRGNRVRVTSIAGSVLSGPPCTFTLVDGKISVTIHDCVNAFEGDHSGGGLLNIGNLNGEAVEVRGVRTGATSMLALRVKQDNLSSGDRHEIRAEVDVNGANSTDKLTVMGIVSQAGACTELEIGDMVISGDEVCDTTAQGINDFLALVDGDTNPGNGPRDIVEVGIDISTGLGTTDQPYPADEWEVEEEDD